MHRYRHILVAADLVETDDDQLVERAIEVAAASQATVSLLHVVEPFYNYVSPFVVEAISQWQEQSVQTSREKLAFIGQKLGIPPERQVVTVGTLRAEILRVAKELMADLILVGSHGRHGISLFLHGSVATDLVSHASCDVLVVNVKPEPVLVESTTQFMPESLLSD